MLDESAYAGGVDPNDKDGTVSLAPLDPEDALRALLAVKPDVESANTPDDGDEESDDHPNG